MKVSKLISVILIIIFILSVFNCAYADSLGEIVQQGDSFISGTNDTVFQTSEMKNLSDYLYNIFLAVGMAIAVIIGIIFGIKFMYSSAEEKAEDKKKLIAYFIGCLILLGGFGIWKVTVSVLQKMDTAESVPGNTDSSSAPQSTSSPDSQNPSSSTSKTETPSSSGHSSESTSNSSISNKRIVLDKTYTKIDMDKTSTLTIQAKVMQDTIEVPEEVVWSSTDQNMATVNNNGVVTPLKGGTVRIRASLKSDSKVYRDCTVVIDKKDVEKIILDKVLLTIDDRHYNYADLTYTITPNDIEDTVTWSSSTPTVATVDENGRVTAVSEGLATITAKSSNGKTASCRVRVLAPMIVNLTGGGRWGGVHQKGVKWNVTDIVYTQEELEEYVNNIESIFKTSEGLQKYSEARQHNVFLRRSPDSNDLYSVVKPSGELAIHDYLSVITTRNQMFYGFKKDENGKWRLELTSTTSTGNAVGDRHFKMYLTGPKNHSSYPAPIFEEGVIGGATSLGNVFHPGHIAGANEDPTPTSAGCVHLGTPNGKLYQWVSNAGRGLRVIYIGPTKSKETSINSAYDDKGYDITLY